MEIEVVKFGDKFILFINDIAMTDPLDTDIECYETYIKEITEQKGLLEFPDENIF